MNRRQGSQGVAVLGAEAVGASVEVGSPDGTVDAVEQLTEPAVLVPGQFEVLGLHLCLVENRIEPLDQREQPRHDLLVTVLVCQTGIMN